MWFESCIDRGVLGAALEEVGFARLAPDEGTPEGADFIDIVRRPASQPAAPKTMSFSLGRRKGSDYIEGVIPAYIAAQQLGDAARARG